MKKLTKVSATVVAISSALILIGPLTAFATAATAPNLGTSATFSVLASLGAMTSALSTTISGDLGDGIAHTGTWNVGGTDYDDAIPAGVSTAASEAYSSMNLTNQPSGTTWDPAANLTPAAGLWTNSSNANLTGELHLNGTASSVWVFQISDSFTFSNGADVILGAGVSACNVFWYITSSATITGASGKTFVGTLIANSNVTLNNVTVTGRMMALTGTLATTGTTIITNPTCTTASLGSSSINVPIFPLINVTKIPSPLNLPAGPGPVTYTYKVTNIGIVPVVNVSVKDNMCSPTHFVSGDTNSDGILALTETWTYNCFKTVSQTETNTVVACGSAANTSSSGIMCDTAEATVAVGVPLTPPLIHLVKVPNVFVLPAGGGLVIYQYFITNPGTVPLSDVSISDDKCASLAVRLASHIGDLNKNSLLDPGEIWNFSCVSKITQTTTNTGTATGHANGFTITDTSPATVVVAPPGVVPKFPNTGLPSYGTSTPLDAAIVVGILMAVLTSLSVIQKRRKM